MAVVSVQLFKVKLFLLGLSICAGSQSVEILHTNEHSERIYQQNETALMTVTYTKPETFITEWSFLAIVVNPEVYPKEVIEFTSKLPDSVKHVLNSTVGTITETIEIETFLNNSGIYTFHIVDPYENTTVRTVDFNLRIVFAPSAVKLVSHFIKRETPDPDVIVYGCWVMGYPLPTITWLFSICDDDDVATGDCETVSWLPIDRGNSSTQFDGAYSRKQLIALDDNYIGLIVCASENRLGRQMREPLEVLSNNIFEFFQLSTFLKKQFTISPQMDGKTVAYSGDTFNLTCQIDLDRKGVVWSRWFLEGTKHILANQSGLDYNIYELDQRHQLSFEADESPPANRKFLMSPAFTRYTLTFNNISNTDAGYYACETYIKGKSFNRSVYVNVVDKFAPTIIGSDTQILFEPASPLTIPCEVDGGPQPTIIWYKDGQILDLRQNSNISVKPHSLEFLRIYESDAGEYMCEATNDVGKARRLFQLTQKTIFQQYKTAIIVAIVVSPFIIIGTVMIIRLAIVNTLGRQNLHRLELELRSNEQNEFDPTLPIFDIINDGPKIKPGYPHCLKVDSLIMDRRNVVKLGEGNFGVVLQVQLRRSDGTEQRVALKRPKCNFEVDQYRMLFKEICLMTYLEKHPNIVNMIGYVSNISRGQLYMVMEYCTEGSLEYLLRSVRQDFRAKFYSELRSENNDDSGVDRYVIEVFPDWPSIKASLKSKGFVFHSDLISYAYQIASAMVYLAEIKFVHRDLAARNVLLSHNFKVAKIADFGLSHQIYRNYKFIDKLKYLPVRWTPPESLIYSEYSSGSDVWSFGTVLGEIFSLGEIPFAHIPDREFNPRKLLTGEIKPTRPKLASDNIYQLILSCCKPERKSRITFADAKMQLGREFDRCCPEEHINLIALLNEIEDKANYSFHSNETSL